MDSDLVTILLEIQKDVAETKEAVKALSGPQGRVTKLEQDAQFQKWYSYAIAPALVGMHAFLRYLGVKI